MSKSTRDFVRGMGQALDMGGAIQRIQQSAPVRRKDAGALRSDWDKIGQDLNHAMIKSAFQVSKSIRSK